MDFSSEAFSDDSELGINMTPLIDIVFLLLIFFMVTTTFAERDGIDVKLPKAESGPLSEVEQSLRLVVEEDGTYQIDGKTVSEATLKDRISQAASSSNSTIIIAADKAASHGKVVAAMDAAKQAGIERIAVSTTRN